MAQSRIPLLLLAIVCGAYAAPIDQDDAAAAVNEAINSQMEQAVMHGHGQGQQDATEDFADLAPYLGESQGAKASSMDPWETKTIAAIRGMSQDKLAVSTISGSELKFAEDTEEAKDVLEQTQQMNDMKLQDAKSAKATEITQQLARASRELGEASDTNAQMDSAENLYEEDEDAGPMEGGIFMEGQTFKQWQATHPSESIDDHMEMVEDSEGKDDFSPQLLNGSDDDVEAQINEQITNAVGDQLDHLSTKKSAFEDGLDEFAKDTQEAAAAVEDMKATIVVPDISVEDIATGAKKAAEKQARSEIEGDTLLGDAEEEHSQADSKLAASDEITASLKRAQAMLSKAKSGMH